MNSNCGNLLSTYCLGAACSAEVGFAFKVRNPDIESPVLATLVASKAVTVILAVPSKLTPLIVLGVANLVAVVALPVTLPVRLAVIVPAAKLPLLSLATIFEAVLVVVASTEIVTGILRLYVEATALVVVLTKLM